MITYNGLINAIVAKMVTVLGKEKAYNYAGIRINEGGEFQGDAKLKDLEKLVESYNNNVGSVSIMLMKGAILSLVAGQNIDLPEKLK